MQNQKMSKRIMKLTLPIVVQNLLSACVSSADVVMLNYVGQSALSAVSLAAQFSSILFCVYYGLGTGATMLCSQYYGKGDLAAIKTVEGISLRLSLLISAVFSILAIFFPYQVMMVLTNDQELISLGVIYLRVMGVCYLFWSVSEVYLSILRSIGQVTITTILNVIAFSLNIGLNALFIFGWFGLPKLGVFGVALATLISRCIQLVGCFIVSMKNKEIKLKFRYIFIKNKVLLGDYIRLTLPALLNDVIWGTAFSMYSVILGHLDSNAVAANSIIAVVRNFATSLCFGVASGSSILLGILIGDNQMKEAEYCGKKAVHLTIIAGIIGGVLILLSTPLILKFASLNLNDEALYYLRYMLYISSYYIMGAAINTTMIVGIFRAGGDSKFGFICDCIDMWCYAVPLGFFAAFVLNLPVLVVYALLCTDEFVKWPWVIKRYKSKIWLNNITRDNVAVDDKIA